MKVDIPQDMLSIILNLVRIQNEQLLKIICEEEDLDYADMQSILPSAYELKTQLRGLLGRPNSVVYSEDPNSLEATEVEPPALDV